jgi:hypothetical protein
MPERDREPPRLLDPVDDLDLVPVERRVQRAGAGDQSLDRHGCPVDRHRVGVDLTERADGVGPLVGRRGPQLEQPGVDAHVR